MNTNKPKYIIQGSRIKGNEIYKEYTEDQKNIALFEYDVTRVVSNYLALYETIPGAEQLQQINLYIKDQ